MSKPFYNHFCLHLCTSQHCPDSWSADRSRPSDHWSSSPPERGTCSPPRRTLSPLSSGEPVSLWAEPPQGSSEQTLVEGNQKLDTIFSRMSKLMPKLWGELTAVALLVVRFGGVLLLAPLQVYSLTDFLKGSLIKKRDKQSKSAEHQLQRSCNYQLLYLTCMYKYDIFSLKNKQLTEQNPSLFLYE